MVGAPAATPETMPEIEPTVACDVLLLLQVPPGVRSLRVVVDPVQTVCVPVILTGVGLTTTPSVTKQPAGNVYVIVGLPAATPPTIPVDPTVARSVLLLIHVPPPTPSVNGVVWPTHTVVLPPIRVGAWFTVIIDVVTQPVGIV